MKSQHRWIRVSAQGEYKGRKDQVGFHLEQPQAHLERTRQPRDLDGESAWSAFSAVSNLCQLHLARSTFEAPARRREAAEER